MSVADIPPSIPLTAPLLVPQALCRNFEEASRLEWLETNHTGAFAMGTVAGVNTRRYHALLISSLKAPADRYSILPRVEETVMSDGAQFPLGTVQYPDVVTPRGFELLEEFRLDPFPQWRYSCGSAAVTKTVVLLDRQQTVLVTYQANRTCTLHVRLFASFRDYHSLTHQNSALRTEVEVAPDRLSFRPYEHLPALTVVHSGLFQADAQWFFRHQYLREMERGLDFEEDLFSPGFLQFKLNSEQSVWLLATLDPPPSPVVQDSDIATLLAAEKKRRDFRGSSESSMVLSRAMDQFRVTRYDGNPSLLAGYPWFTDWSRDILISLPALSASGFAPSETKQILTMLLGQRSQGLLPNRFLDSGSQPEYNTADGTLWLFIAAKAYLDGVPDATFLRDVLYPAAVDILAWHRRGTFYGIHIDPADHLLWAGEPTTQMTSTNLTWMDARVNGSAVTPRVGKPVEINALWYNALRINADWARLIGFAQTADDLEAEAAQMLAAFRSTFWNEQRGCLFDVVAGSARDARLRPNQLFALSLPYPLIERQRARLIVDLVTAELLTPVGLRTLEPGDPAYRPRFEGAMSERDAAYHQGTVWPWLIGPFVSASLYAYGESEETVRRCRDLLTIMEQQLTACCLGSLAEVYDASPPYLPGGCPAQLWSVAQLILAARRLDTPSRP